ncbi:MAG: exodeoxyribonuclease VII large subunit [Acidobacteriota bacterium]|nr:MAG: exodeoxyribonuclease VII large subunit [Acidobacteriota bacterium]
MMTIGSPGSSAPERDQRPGSRWRPLTVTEINEVSDQLLAEHFGPAWVTGEVSRFLAHRSGHWYFTLKDDRSAVSCAMFRSRNRVLRFDVEDGLEVLALAVPGVYAPQGRYQLIVESLEPRGRGAMALALEQLKARLAAEGLFDSARKKPLPLLPRRLGVVTSPDGAAIRDVLRVLRRRFCGVCVLLAPVPVQGNEAAEAVASALGQLDRRGLDVLLVVRGGGAREDLLAFDDERVVRAIAACRTPVVTGIGHAIDTTLADLAADVPAATPSAAAEQVVRERAELLQRLATLRRTLVRAVIHELARRKGRLHELRGARGMGRVPLKLQRVRLHLGELVRRLERAVGASLRAARERWADLAERLSPAAWSRRVAERRRELARIGHRLARAVAARLHAARRHLAALAARLEALSPLAVLERGYVLVTREVPRGLVVDDPARLAAGDELYLRWSRGGALAEVRRVDLDQTRAHQREQNHQEKPADDD